MLKIVHPVTVSSVTNLQITSSNGVDLSLCNSSLINIHRFLTSKLYF